jgi:LacI family transcriptional regulator
MVNERITYKHIAAKTGVSLSTVSRSLHRDPRINAQTAERVRQAAAELGWRPDPALAALVAYRGKVATHRNFARLAFLNGWGPTAEALPDFARMQLESARRHAETLSYGVDVFELGPTRKAQAALGRVLKARGLIGLLVGPLPESFSKIELPWDDFCAVSLGPSLREPALATARVGITEAVRLGLKMARERGARRPALCHPRGSEERNRGLHVAGFLADEFFQGAKGADARVLLYEDEAEIGPWYERVKPDVILSTHAFSLTNWLRARGVKTPGETGVISLGNYYDPASGYPRLDLHLEEIGAHAVDLLVAMLRRNERGLPAHPLTLLSPARVEP